MQKKILRDYKYMKEEIKMSKEFYQNPDNLYKVLGFYLLIFSEGNRVNVPMVKDEEGNIKVRETLNLPCYREFPASEVMRWKGYREHIALGMEAKGQIVKPEKKI